MKLTIGQLAKRFNTSRASILYYEKQQLLAPCIRAENGYRWYGDKAIQRLQMVLSYRSYGLSLDSIKQLLGDDNQSQVTLLSKHFDALSCEIERLKSQQMAIVALLNKPELLEETMVTKQRWVEIMKAAGFDEAAMTRWHQKFEQMEPQEHYKFLQSLGISEEEITRIRAL